MWDVERIDEKGDLSGWDAVLVRGDVRRTVSLELTMGTSVTHRRAVETVDGLTRRDRLPDRVVFQPSGAVTESTQLEP